ncbi:MAG: AI-2E family transporter [Bdellovibrionales bacterium]|nr:AI-2E family transporter [Bdellovibrionales bacterium]
MKDTYARTNNICLVIITMVTLAFALYITKPVLLPLIFSIFLYSIMTPMVHGLQNRLKLPRALAILAAVLILFLFLSLIVLVVTVSVDNFVQGAPKYKASLNESIEYLENQMFLMDFDLDKVREALQSLPLFAYAQKATGQLLSFMGNLFLVFIFTIFMMAGDNGERKKKPTSRLLGEILGKISSYISSKTSLSLITGFIVWLVLFSFNVELAFIFGLLTVLLNFIPTIGSILAVALPLPLVFLQYQFQWQFFAVLILCGVTQFTVGNVIEPKIMGDTMDLHPITVLIGLMFWGLIWGIPGMFLAVPITATLKIIFTRIEATQPLAELLAGRIPSRSR